MRNKFDEIIKDKLRDFEVSYDATDWDKMKDKLASGSSSFKRWVLFVSVFLLLFFTGIVVKNIFNVKVEEKEKSMSENIKAEYKPTKIKKEKEVVEKQNVAVIKTSVNTNQQIGFAADERKTNKYIGISETKEKNIGFQSKEETGIQSEAENLETLSNNELNTVDEIFNLNRQESIHVDLIALNKNGAKIEENTFVQNNFMGEASNKNSDGIGITKINSNKVENEIESKNENSQIKKMSYNEYFIDTNNILAKSNSIEQDEKLINVTGIEKTIIDSSINKSNLEKNLNPRTDNRYWEVVLINFWDNPALAGNFENKNRISLIGSFQSSSFYTGDISYEVSTKKGDDKYYWGIGIHAANKQSGVSNYKNIDAAITYNRLLSKGALSFALMTGYNLHSIDLQNSVFGSQWDGYGYNLPSSESFFEKRKFLDFSTGLWYNSNKIHGGISLINILNPNTSFYVSTNSEKTNIRILNMFLGYNMHLSSTIFLFPTLRYQRISRINRYCPSVIATYKEKYMIGFESEDFKSLKTHLGYNLFRKFLISAYYSTSGNFIISDTYGVNLRGNF